MTRRDWSRARPRKPTEDAAHHPSVVAPLLKRKPKPPRLSKAQLRAMAEAALATWQGQPLRKRSVSLQGRK